MTTYDLRKKTDASTGQRIIPLGSNNDIRVNNLENRIVNAALILFPPELTKYFDKRGIKGTSDLMFAIMKLFTNFKSASIRSIMILVESLLVVLMFLL